MPLLDRVPEIQVDPLAIPPLVPFGLFYNILAPFLPLSEASRPKKVNPHATWTLELECHYQKFHPSTWDILRADEWLDDTACDDLAKEIVHVEEEDRAGIPGARLRLMDLRDTIEIIRRRRSARWWSLFSLDHARGTWITQQIDAHPEFTWQEVLYRCTPPGNLNDRAISVPSGSVWPLPIKPPRDNLLVLNLASRNWEEHVLPDVCSAESAAALERLDLGLVSDI
ncbi:uncharacterized protein JCM10292_005759 [Rhodotorula paludigena]|uniref:uncharacterized protein n=1 Tax=Rhodotorula paludigena TaxID=86838 RepID=UPI0031733482